MAKRLAKIGDEGTVLLASGVTELPFPPVTWGLVPQIWLGYATGVPGRGVVPTADIHIRAEDTVQLTNVKLYQGRSYDVTLDPATFTDADVDVATNEITINGHDYLPGDGPLPVTVDPGDVPLAGLPDGTDVWIIVVDPNTVKFASSVQNALAGTEIDLDYGTKAELDLGGLAAGNIDIVVEALLPGVGGEAITLDIVFDAPAGPTLTEVGNAVTLHVKNNVTTNGMLGAVLATSTKLSVKTGTATPGYVLQAASDNFPATALAVVTGNQGFTLTDEEAKRFHWALLGNLGTLDLGPQLSVVERIDHAPQVIAYAISAEFSAAVDVSVTAEPIVDWD